jgi:hypothetical protein
MSERGYICYLDGGIVRTVVVTELVVTETFNHTKTALKAMENFEYNG